MLKKEVATATSVGVFVLFSTFLPIFVFYWTAGGQTSAAVAQRI